MSNICKVEGPAMGIGLNDWEVDVETHVDGDAEGPAMGVELNGWVADIETGVRSFSLCDDEKNWTATSIPSLIRDIRKDAFTPTVVSFGPYHHDDPKLRPMEEHKRRALVQFIKMANKPLDHFTQAMRAVEKQLQDSYQNLDKKWKDPRHPDQFLMLMILDGCFMLEVVRMTDDKHRKKRYATHDPVFGIDGVNHMLPYIMKDMLLLENQLPLLVLKKLLEVEGLQSDVDDVSINNMVLQFFEASAKITRLGLHPLDVYRKSLLPPLLSSDTPLKTSQLFIRRSIVLGRVINSAVELHRRGVKFKKSVIRNLAAINFEDGVLTLPSVRIDDNTESMLLNIMALEHLHVGIGSEVISYAYLMGQVIDSAKDVDLLVTKGIIYNTQRSSKTVAEFFGRLSKVAVTTHAFDGFYDVWRQVIEYSLRPAGTWNVWGAD